MQAYKDLMATAERIVAGGFVGMEFSRLIP